MIELEEAISIINQNTSTIDTEKVDFMQSLDRILSQDIFSDCNMPPFNKSAMDGFACKQSDLAMPLKVIESIQAGSIPQKTITEGTASKIMTGAMLPQGADCVVKIEDIAYIDSDTIRSRCQNTNPNICYLGEDVKAGEKILSNGTLIRPQEIAMLASAGVINPEVYRQPIVGVISTGNELIEPQFKVQESKIRNSNAYQLLAQLKKINCLSRYYGIVIDHPTAVADLIKKAKLDCDIVLLTGGVSMGDFDFVPHVIRELGFEILFHSIAVQPGKPTIFAKKGNTYLFGLPGNPVSSFIQFHLLVRQLVSKMMKLDSYSQYEVIEMAFDYSRKKSHRKAFIPIVVKDGKAYNISYHGSAHIHSLHHANAIIEIEKGIDLLKKGDLVHARHI